jgi:SNF2 family DNA or RNA helicase
MTYTPKRTPWAHQAKAIERLEGKRHFALLMRMRTGKTKVTLDDFGRLWDANEVDDLLVVAPAGVYRTWVTALQDHADPNFLEQCRVHVYSAAATARSNGEAKRITEFLGDQSRPRVLLMNAEALGHFNGTRNAHKMATTFLSQRRVYMALDESTVIRNPDAKKSAYIAYELGPRARYRRILTGLLTPGGPFDAFMQFEFLRPGVLGFSNIFTFKSRYGVTKKLWVPGRPNASKERQRRAHTVEQIVGYKNVADLAQRVAPHAFRVALEECYDMPPKIYQTREVELTDEQSRIYRELLAYATAKLSDQKHVTATEAMTQILRLHQVLCGHVRDEEGEIHEVPTNREKELLELIEQHDGKAIIWCSYDHDIRRVVRALEKEYGLGCCARFWGGNVPTREMEERQFQEEPECRFMVATPAAGGRGRMWAAADLVVYYSSSYDLEHRDQSEERPQAVGKTTSVLYVDLMARGTVDEKIIQCLRDKIDLAAQVSGDGWKSWVV